MKNILLTLGLFLLTTVQAQINFQENVSFASIQAQAKQENKLIFMDCYTTWCGPCKWLVKNVFADQSVAEVYNSQFINFKSDMEKGEGLDLATRFKITAYPTLLWLNSDGEVVYTVVGTNTPEAFVEFANNLKNTDNQFPSLVKRYNAGDRDPGFLKMLAETAQLGGDENAVVYSEAYLKAIPEENWSKESNKILLLGACSDLNALATTYVLAHRELFDSEMVDMVISGCLNMEMSKVLESKSTSELELFLKKVDEVAPDYADYKIQAEMYFYRGVGNTKKVNELASEFMKTCEDPGLLNEFAWERYESVTDVKLLEEAVSWALKSVKLDENYYNTDTLGQLYKKLGKKRKATKWLKRSKKLEPQLSE